MQLLSVWPVAAALCVKTFDADTKSVMSVVLGMHGLDV